MRKETTALAKAFRVLSDEFGVQQKEVINIAADWAAAGVSGAALAKVTKHDARNDDPWRMDAASATKALIAIQAQYQLSTKQLSEAIDILNMVENQTGTTMEDLVVSLSGQLVQLEALASTFVTWLL
jgi:TP901 family phage tail tape measure protein